MRDDRAVANAFATLAELRYFNKPDTKYRARCDVQSDSLTTRDAPFADLVVLPLDDAGINRAADGLMRDLLSLDRTAAGRAGRMPDVRANPIRLPATCDPAAWGEPNGGPAGRPMDRPTWKAAAAARGWLSEQWAALELGPEALWGRLKLIGESALGRPVADAFTAEAGPAELLRPEALPEVFNRAWMVCSSPGRRLHRRNRRTGAGMEHQVCPPGARAGGAAGFPTGRRGSHGAATGRAGRRCAAISSARARRLAQATLSPFGRPGPIRRRDCGLIRAGGTRHC